MGNKKALPSYLKLSQKELDKKIENAYSLLKECTLCPRKCKVNRTNNEKGFCKSGLSPIVSSFNPHFGEESPLVGKNGSGTIFFTNCNLGCIFCQNYEISHLEEGKKISLEDLAKIMLYLQNLGCHNINLVTPTHFTPQIISALKIAIENGLEIPLVYNCGGYEEVNTLKILDGIIDIYMPDIKYSDENVSEKLSKARNYPEVIKNALKEMHRQVGDLQLDKEGIAIRGLLIRHLVLPNNFAGTKKVMEFIAKEISCNSYINIMDQYRPCYQAKEIPEINRRITNEEYKEAINSAFNFNLKIIKDERKLIKILW